MNIINTRFVVTATNLFLLPGNPHMIHLGTIRGGLKEYIVMQDRRNRKTYIEEVIINNSEMNTDAWASFKFIEDDNLALDLAKFAEEKKLIDMKRITEFLIDQGKQSWLIAP